MEPSKTEKVIGKINALRKIADSTHSKSEKETCMTLAAKLIAEHQLSEAELAVQGDTGEPIDLDSESIIYESGRLSLWKGELAQGIATLNGLFLYNAGYRDATTHRNGRRYRIIGRKSDVEIALYMMTYLTTMIHDLSFDYVPGNNGGKRGVNPQRESWSLGCVRGYLAKMTAEKDAVNQAATSTALVFIGNKAQEAEAAFVKKTKMTFTASKFRSHAQYSSSTYDSGFRKGGSLNINAGLGTDKEPNKLEG